MNEFEDKIDWIEESLLTEEGFLNEACINELNKTIINMPKSGNLDLDCEKIYVRNG